jgi:hypothetical protein
VLIDLKSTFSVTVTDATQLTTGVYSSSTSGESDPDYVGAGTHEYSYAQ